MFIGANGSGKSNLLEALGVLSAAAVRDQWPRVRKLLNEAERFSASFEGTREVARVLAKQTKLI